MGAESSPHSEGVGSNGLLGPTRMSATTGTVHIRLRPIRLGFLVDPHESAAVQEAMGISSFLWGGAFNPIIPAPARIPRAWGLHSAARTSIRKIVRGFVDAFDPDYIVPLGFCTQRQHDVGNRDCLKAVDILPDPDDYSIPKCGVGLFEILKQLHDKEFKFKRRDPLTMDLPIILKRHSLFLTSVFGGLPPPLAAPVLRSVEEHFGGKRLPCTVENYTEFLAPQNLFLRRISSLYIERRPLGRRWGNNCVFVLDPSSTSDIIDYWNLRAGGWNVIPVPSQASSSATTLGFVRCFIEANCHPLPHNPGTYTDTTILKSRSISEGDVASFARALDIPPPKASDQSRYTFQTWQPRIWDEWARERDGIECCGLQAEDARHDVSAERIVVPTLDPEFVEGSSGAGRARYVNEVELDFYGGKEFLAEVIPEGSQRLMRSVGGFGYGGWRFSGHGLAHLVDHPGWTIQLSTPKAEPLFKAWLEERGWKAEISSAGHVAREMARNLGGRWGLSLLANEGIVKLLCEMQKKGMRHQAFWGRIQQIANAERHPADPSRLLQGLMDSGMFRLGIEIQCPVCTQTSWYSLTDLNYDVKCPVCYERFTVPSHSPNDMCWSYRVSGPFALPGAAFGVYTVLLTLRFFSQLRRAATTPIMSFTADKDGRTMEVDLGVLCRDSLFRECRTELILAECKTYNEFAAGDARRMRQLADDFPGAVLVFATLRKSLTNQEKRLIRPIVNRGRRYWKADHPYNPVLILTGVELFADRDPPACWEGAGARYGRFMHRHFGCDQLLELCDCTQQIYLDMTPWREWMRDQIRRRRTMRAAQPDGSAPPTQRDMRQ